ncbi:MAG: N-acetylneuraminate synthase [Desulfurivibrio sp.]|nr:MAG: N-acetylneuraminate synthase [Desulfurivibrio sp.]
MNYFQGKNGPYIIAEIGGNHEGNMEYARKLTCLAAESGADAVKFQIYTGDSLVNPLLDPDRNKHFKKFELTPEQYIELALLCRKLNVAFMASVWDINAFHYIDPYIGIYKIGSGDLTAFNLLKKAVATGKPLILSTGLATGDEVLASIAFIRQIDSSYITDKKVAILQCTAMYPIPDGDANLNVMHTLARQTGLPVGYSDHTVGMEALETAVAMGAQILEMHFTDTRENKTFRDHQVSATQNEIQQLIEKIKKTRLLQGGYEKKPAPSEIGTGHIHSFRRGVYPARDLRKDTIIQEEDLVTLRPCKGIAASFFYELIGKRLLVDVQKMQELSFDFFEFPALQSEEKSIVKSF